MIARLTALPPVAKYILIGLGGVVGFLLATSLVGCSVTSTSVQSDDITKIATATLTGGATVASVDVDGKGATTVKDIVVPVGGSLSIGDADTSAITLPGGLSASGDVTVGDVNVGDDGTVKVSSVTVPRDGALTIGGNS